MIFSNLKIEATPDCNNMKNNFDHYVIIRFNVKMNSLWGTNHKDLIKENWLDYRFNIFKKYTLPTLLYQTTKNFKCIILVDINTPKKFIKKLEEINIFHKIYYVDGEFGFVYSTNQAKLFSKYLIGKTNKPYIITSSLDSDDSIHRDYISIIQKKFNYQNKTLILNKTGYKYYIKINVLTYFNVEFPSYVNLIEKKHDLINTCYFCGHCDIINYFEIETIKNIRLWITNVHELNDCEKNNLFNKNKPFNIARNKNEILKQFIGI